MAGKTLINGTAYDITGGTCLKDGTSYSVKNGKVLISGTEYDISFLLPSGALSLWSSPYVNCEITCIAYGNGYWVVGGVRYDAGVYYARIAYATSLDGPWTAKNLWRNSTNTFGPSTCLNCITYANGVFVVGGGQYLDTASEWYPRIAYTASPNLTWTIKDIWTGYRYDSITSIARGNGYWIVGGMYGTGSVYHARVAYATSLGSTWTTTNMWGGTTGFNTINSIIYESGYFALCGTQDVSNAPAAMIAYCTTPTSWHQKQLWLISSNYNSTFSGRAMADIAYGNGYWVVCGTYANTNIVTRVAYATSPDGTWYTKNLYDSTYTYCRPTAITYANGQWVVCDRYTNSNNYSARVWYGNSPSTITNLKSVWGSVSGNEGVYAVAYADGYLVVGGMHYDGTAYNAQIAYASAPDKLPTVT